MKVGVLQRLDNGGRASKLSKELGIPPGTISLWKQPSTRAQIFAERDQGSVDPARKRIRQSAYPDIEDTHNNF